MSSVRRVRSCTGRACSGSDGHQSPAAAATSSSTSGTRGRLSVSWSSRRYGTLTTTVCGRPSRAAPKALGRLVVEHSLPPAARDVLRDDHERDRLWLARRPRRVEDVEVGKQRAGEGPVRRVDDDQRDARDLALECRSHAGRLVRVIGDVDGPDVVVDRAADVDRLDRGPVDAVDRARRSAPPGLSARTTRSGSTASWRRDLLYWRLMNSIIPTRTGTRITTR